MKVTLWQCREDPDDPIRSKLELIAAIVATMGDDYCVTVTVKDSRFVLLELTGGQSAQCSRHVKQIKDPRADR